MKEIIEVTRESSSSKKENRNRRIYDCFPFLDELDIFEMRLQTLNLFFDVVVIAQANHTHRGKRWNPILDSGHNLVKKYERLVEFRFVYSPPIEDSVWGREKEQRRSIDSALNDINRNDIIFISDVDEIPSVEQVQNSFKMGNLLHCVPLKTKINYMNMETPGLWRHAKVVSGSKFAGAQTLREQVLLPDLPGQPGHHLTVIDGLEGWKRKFEITPHTEMIMDPQELNLFLERDLYPSRNLITLWKGGRLTKVSEVAYDSLLRVGMALHPEYFKSFKCPFSNHEKKCFITYSYLRGRFQSSKSLVGFRPKNPRLWFPVLRLVYFCFFPIRVWSVFYRKGMIRSRIRKRLEAVL